MEAGFSSLIELLLRRSIRGSVLCSTIKDGKSTAMGAKEKPGIETLLYIYFIQAIPTKHFMAFISVMLPAAIYTNSFYFLFA
jgi:hypothetical protein